LPSHRDFSLHTNFSRTPSTLHFYSIPHYSIFYTFVSTTPPLRPGARAAWHHSQGPRQGSGGVFLSLQAWRCPFSLPTMEFIVEVWATAFSTPNNSSKRVGEWWRCGVRIVLAAYSGSNPLGASPTIFYSNINFQLFFVQISKGWRYI